ncbi:MAG: hypothetical protein ABFS86_06775, partial [Planctomycetota bacterium]
RHIDACQRCATYRAGLVDLDDLLSADPVLAWTPSMTSDVVTRVRAERRSRFALGLAAAAVVVLAGWLSIGLVPVVPGLSTVGAEVGTRMDLPASPTEAASRVADGLSGLLAAFFGSLSSATFAAGAPVALLAVLGLFLLNAITAGRVRLAGRRS